MKAILIVALIAIAVAGWIGYRATEPPSHGCPSGTHRAHSGYCVGNG